MNFREICFVLFNNILKGTVKDKVLPYSLPSVGPGADPDVQAISLQVTTSHPPAVGCHYFLPGLRFTFVSVHQMAPPLTEVTYIHTSNYSLLLIYRPERDERLSWPGWLTYIGRFTHISGLPLATGRV